MINFLSTLTLLSDIFLFGLTAYLLFRLIRKIAILEIGLALLSQRAWIFVFIISLTATAGSLFFSEIAKFVPCELCWFQRIFMYPQAAISLLALITRDAKAAKYIIALSSIGAAFSLYHYHLQLFPPVVTECSLDADCAERFVFAYGYITFAFMALTAFVLNIALMILKKRFVRVKFG
jgi:hypothetical protein